MEDFGYRSAVPDYRELEKDRSIDKDEMDYSTLVAVRAQFKEMIDSLDGFNAFDYLERTDPDQAAKEVFFQIRVNKAVSAVLIPLFDEVNSTIERIDLKNQK